MHVNLVISRDRVPGVLSCIVCVCVVYYPVLCVCVVCVCVCALLVVICIRCERWCSSIFSMGHNDTMWLYTLPA